MKKIVIAITVIAIIFNSNFMLVKADEEIPFDIPTGAEWENIPECHQWPDPNTSMPRWKYTVMASVYLTFTDNHANILIDVDGYDSATRIEAVMVYEEQVNGVFIEKKRETAYKNANYLFHTSYPSATYGHTYRVTAIIRVFSGSDYDYITLRSTKTYNSASTVSLEEIQH